jgi:hypothetical protein
MPYPLRFFGAGYEMEIDGVIIPPRCTVEVTFRTLNEQFLLRPDRKAKAAVLACLGRAAARHPGVQLHVASMLSNHGTLLCTPDSEAALSDFMQEFMSTSARKVNRLRGRRGTFWARRYRAIPIVGEAKIDERFAYVLTQGTKENLVWSARDWPGLQSVDAWLGGAPLVGYWRNRQAEGERRRRLERKRRRAAQRGQAMSAGKTEPQFIEYRISLVPPPHWAHLSVGQQRARVADMVRRDDESTRARHEQDGTEPLGVRGILAQDPFGQPANPKRSPAPLCHAPDRRTRRAYQKAYRAYRERYDASVRALDAQVPALGFAAGTATPSLVCRPPRRDPNRPTGASVRESARGAAFPPGGTAEPRGAPAHRD